MNEPAEPFRFIELSPLADRTSEMPPLESYRARDGALLGFRRYRAESNAHLVLTHGSSGHSAYLHAFATYLSDTNAANVHAPDLRGHGPSPQRRGDIDYIDQLEDDLADLIGHVRKDVPQDARIIVGGHSSGGGLALRFGGGRHGRLAHGFILLAPYLGHRAPMVRKNAGGWADPSIAKIVGLNLMNAFGMRRFNGARVLRFNLPEKYRNGLETLEYSFRLMKGMHPDDYRKSLKSVRVPLLIIIGSADEAFQTESFERGILPYKPDARISFVKDGSHLGILMSEPAMAETARWIAVMDAR